MFILVLVFIFAIIPCAVFGYVIAVKQQRTLITFWDDAKYHDPAAAAKVLGNSLMLMAAFLLVLHLAFAAGLIRESLAGTLFLIISALPVGALVYMRRKYRRRPPQPR